VSSCTRTGRSGGCSTIHRTRSIAVDR
jgi:hypothetical protein